jgi:hypothetical protein
VQAEIEEVPGRDGEAGQDGGGHWAELGRLEMPAESEENGGEELSKPKMLEGHLEDELADEFE